MRFFLVVGLALLMSLACGSALIGWHEANAVQTELRAALDVGARTVRNGLRGPAQQADELRRLVGTFDGNRHIRATLLDASGQSVIASELFAPTVQVPDWFRALVGGEPAPVRIAAGPVGAAMLLQADATNEVGEVWSESRDAVLVLAFFAVLTGSLVSAFATRMLRPLRELSMAFQRIGEGDYQGAVSVRGPPELVRLATGFNGMSQRLAAAESQNRRLNERLLTLQAEERADLARDLHDEVGPLLFAVDMTAAAIKRLADSGRVSDIPAQVGSIHDAVGRMQRHVRSILERLRPLQATGLEAAISRLVAFWQTQRPEIRFTVQITVEDDVIDANAKEAIYRVIQEAVSNAVRHGRPAAVSIAITQEGTDSLRVDVTDDGVGLSPANAAVSGPARFGLIGMRERVMALAGSLSLQHGGADKGLTLVVRLPLHQQDATS